MVTIVVSTQQMLTNYLAVINEVAFENGEAPNDMTEIVRAFVIGDMEAIREFFRQGCTALFVGESGMELIEMRKSDTEALPIQKEAEIRVYHKGQLIGVVIDSEIRY